MSWLFLLSLVTFSSWAADELEEIQVKASKEVKDFSFASSTEISSYQIEKEPLPLVSRQLEEVNGVIAIQSGGPGTQTSYFIRGTNSGHLAFTMDNLKINDPSGVNRAFDSAFLTTPMVQSMTVHKGPQAVLFGSDSFGGLVDLKTRKGANAPETRLNVMGGSFGTAQISLGNDWKTKTSNGTLTWTEFRTDGISSLNKKRYDAKERDGSQISQLSSSSEHRWAPKFQTDLLLSYLKGKNEFDNAFAARVDTNDHSKNDHYILQQKTNYELNKTSSVSLRNGLSRQQRFLHTSNPNTYNGNLIQNEMILRKDFQDISLLSGLANEYESYQDESADEKANLNSAFMQSVFKFNKLKFQVGGRYDNHSKFNNFTTGSTGLSYEYWDNIFSVQYSQGYKAPTLYQLYAPVTPWGGGNKDLRPESNHSIEARWERKTQRWDNELVFFENRLSNLIIMPTNLPYRNGGKLIAQGAEANTSFKEKYFKIVSGLTHQKFREATDPVVRRPLNYFRANFIFTPVESNEISLNYKWFSSRKDSLWPSTVKLNSYEVVDLRYRYIQENYDFSLEIRNLLDRDYEELYGYSVMPRSVFSGFGYRFH